MYVCIYVYIYIYIERYFYLEGVRLKDPHSQAQLGILALPCLARSSRFFERGS